jgi:hypothetical protein
MNHYPLLIEFVRGTRISREPEVVSRSGLAPLALARPAIFRDHRFTMAWSTRWIKAVDPAVARALRAMSGMERLRLGHETWETARDRLAAYVAHRHPEWGPKEVQREVARRLLGDAGRPSPIPR